MRDLMRTEQRTPIGETLEGMRREGRRRLRPMAVLFAVVALGAIAIGWNWPKKYHAAATILVAEDKTIQKLMEGRAVPTSITERAMIAREVMFGRKVMDEILRLGGWLDDEPDPAERTRRAEQVQSRTVIGAPRENLIRVEYWDTDPLRAQRVAQRFVDLFQQESRATQLGESREAYDFIAGQVERYRGVLLAAENRLREYREAHPDERQEPPALVESRLAELRARVERERDLLERPVFVASAAAAAAVPDLRAEQRAALQRELAAKRLEYTDAHPDVLELQRRLDALGPAPPPVLAADRTDRPQRASRGSRARLAEAEREFEQERQRALRAADPSYELAALLREHELARDLYQDLLRRLEYARLSMTLDEQGRGLEFRTHEPASVPARPSGVRFAHFAVGGLAAAVALPLGLLFLFVRFDPHLRSPQAIGRATGLPLLASLPALHTEPDRRLFRSDVRFVAWVVMLTFTLVVAMSLLRLWYAR
jgi:polysaccharide chain length determinant protein (PEP-CTERM system associated)